MLKYENPAGRMFYVYCKYLKFWGTPSLFISFCLFLLLMLKFVNINCINLKYFVFPDVLFMCAPAFFFVSFGRFFWENIFFLRLANCKVEIDEEFSLISCYMYIYF